MQDAIRVLGPVDCAELTMQVQALSEEIWCEDQRRQVEYRNVHSQTQSVLLIFCEGWPNPKISYHKGWTYLGQAAAPVMRAVVGRHYQTGGKILRAMVARLRPGAKIDRHRDVDPSFAVSHRVHIPLQTNSGVHFIVGSERIATPEGVAFELNNGLPHQVSNHGSAHRIHFIFDYLTPQAQSQVVVEAGASTREQ